MRCPVSISCLLLLAGVAIATPEQGLPRVFRCDPATLAGIRSRALAHDARTDAAVQRLLAQAGKDMTGGPYAVTQKKHPAPGGDPHDYVSLAPYFWPNPDTPDHLPYVRHDGRRNPEIREYDASRFGAMSGHAYTLSLAYYLTGHEPYARRSALLLRTWFLDPATCMNPNLEHAQLVKGLNDGRGTGIIESDRLLDVVDAVGLLRDSPAWTASDQKGMEDWFRRYIDWMVHSRQGKQERAATNNHGTWYDVQLVTYCLFIGDETQARQVAEEARTRRIAAQIEPDGSMPRELTRTNALGYSVYNLEALTELADLGERLDVDLWNYKTADGRSLRPAIDFLLPYVTGRRKWARQQITAFKESSMFIPLRRAARAYHDPNYQQTSNTLKGADPSASLDAMRYPGFQK